MAKPTNSSFTTVITVDMQESVIRFLSMTSGNQASLRQETKKCRTKLFDTEFFQVFQKLITEYSQEHPSAQAAGITLVLPDRTVATNTLSIPTLRRKKTSESLSVAINELYKNASALKINYHVTNQNRQFTSYSLSMMKNDLLSSFYSACSAGKMLPQAVTYSANGSVNAVSALMPKLRGASYLLMDIKSGYTRFSFVTGGITCGYFSIPFGYSILEHYRIAAEDMLFDHSQADLLVLNAKEKAQAKSLTMMENESASQMAQAMANDESAESAAVAANEQMNRNDDDEDEASLDIFASAAAQANRPAAIKTLPQKQPRKLPRFMVREVEHTAEAYVYENFRLFMKWALNLVQENQKQLWQEKPDTVYVNMPNKFAFLYEMANAEKKENGITFAPIEAQGVSENILGNLESYGGFFVSQYNENNNF